MILIAFLCFCGLTFLSPSVVVAQILEEELPYKFDPVKQWIAVVKGEEIELLEADLEKTPDKLKLSVFVKGLEKDALVTGVAISAQGEMTSGALHLPWQNEMAQESIRVAQEQADQLQKKIAASKDKIRRLEDEINVTNLQVRKAAGLGEVDNIYEKIAVLDSEIEGFKYALKSLESGSADLEPPIQARSPADVQQ